MTLARSSVGTAPSALTDDRLVVLTTDGVHDALAHDRMAELVREYQHDPKGLAEALVAEAARCAAGGADDATAAVLALT